MLNLIVPSRQLFDENTQTFLYTNETVLNLEHSLISISKWESIWKKPFFETTEMTRDESISYIKCMSLNKHAPDEVFMSVTDDEIDNVVKYMNDSMTATWFADNKDSTSGKKQIVTSELVYYWMIMFNIPVEFEKWHINRLMTLIRIFIAKNQKKDKKRVSKKDFYSQRDALNKKRRAAHNSKG